jgi:prophage tail gpP-like protein
MSEVILRLGSQRFDGWKAINITRSMECFANDFSLEVTDRWSAEKIAPIQNGSPCEILIDSGKVITGYVDEISPTYSESSRRIRVRGRSKTADLVDCSNTLTQQFKNQTFLQIGRALCKPFVIDVINEAGLTEKFSSKQFEVGQTTFDCLAEMARHAGVRLMTNADGNAVIARTGTRKVKTPLKLGDNILEAEGSFSLRDRFSDYMIASQFPGDNNINGAAAAHIKGVSADRAMRYRPIFIQSETPLNQSMASKRAIWQRNTAFGASQSVTYTVGRLERRRWPAVGTQHTGPSD